MFVFLWKIMGPYFRNIGERQNLDPVWTVSWITLHLLIFVMKLTDIWGSQSKSLERLNIQKLLKWHFTFTKIPTWPDCSDFPLLKYFFFSFWKGKVNFAKVTAVLLLVMYIVQDERFSSKCSARQTLTVFYYLKDKLGLFWIAKLFFNWHHVCNHGTIQTWSKNDCL